MTEDDSIHCHETELPGLVIRCGATMSLEQVVNLRMSRSKLYARPEVNDEVARYTKQIEQYLGIVLKQYWLRVPSTISKNM